MFAKRTTADVDLTKPASSVDAAIASSAQSKDEASTATSKNCAFRKGILSFLCLFV